MSDWNFLNRVRVNNHPQIPKEYWSTPEYGFNGMFRFTFEGQALRVIAGEGDGWQHVSVTVEGDKRPPKWKVMCAVKDLFFEPEHWVVQYHPAQEVYVNMHPGCLHLWRPLDAPLPTPPKWMV
jgi:hypothetical protein